MILTPYYRRFKQNVLDGNLSEVAACDALGPNAGFLCLNDNGVEERVQAALAAGHRLVVQDIPLLIESGHWPRQLSAVLVVDCRESTQISRVVARSALTPAAVQAIMASQASRQQRRAGADIVLYNDGLSLPALQAQVRLVAQRFGL